MPEYDRPPERILESGPNPIASFVTARDAHMDEKTVRSFGEEWQKFSEFSDAEIRAAGDQYFDLVTPGILPQGSTALDVGCGSGRWSRYLSPLVARVEAIDPGEAVHTAVRMVGPCGNVRVTQAGIGSIPFADGTFNFVFSLGVLHHVPDTAGAMRDVVKKLKAGGWFLVYLYYKVENRGVAFRTLYSISNSMRQVVSTLPGPIKRAVCEVLALVVYAPLVGLASAVNAVLPRSSAFRRLPLSYYVGKSYRTIRNDALDRFGTPLEQRFSRAEIESMMRGAGLTDIRFSESEPFWHAIGRKPEGSGRA